MRAWLPGKTTRPMARQVRSGHAISGAIRVTKGSHAGVLGQFQTIKRPHRSSLWRL